MGFGVVCQSCNELMGAIDTFHAPSTEEISGVLRNFFCESCVTKAYSELGVALTEEENWKAVFEELRKRSQ